MGQQRIERASAIDMMELASATTPAAGQIGAVLFTPGNDILLLIIVGHQGNIFGCGQDDFFVFHGRLRIAKK